MAKKKSKASSAEVIARKLQVEDWLKYGLTRSDIVKQVKILGWKISTEKGSVLDGYIHFVKENWAELAKAESPFQLHESEQKKYSLYLEARQKGDYSTARAILSDLDRLHGLIRDRGVVAQIPINGGFNLTEEEEEQLAKDLGIIYKKRHNAEI